MFCTLADVKTLLNISNTSSDAVLNLLISAATVYIQKWLSRDILAGDYTDVFDGQGGPVRPTNEYPINTVSSVSVDGIVIPACQTDIDYGYVVGTTAVHLRGYSWSRGVKNCRISYNAGFSTVPDGISHACKELVINRFKALDRIGQKSKQLAGETVTFEIDAMTQAVVDMLYPYRRVAPL